MKTSLSFSLLLLLCLLSSCELIGDIFKAGIYVGVGVVILIVVVIVWLISRLRR